MPSFPHGQFLSVDFQINKSLDSEMQHTSQHRAISVASPK